MCQLAPGGLEAAIAVEIAAGGDESGLDSCLERGVLVMGPERVTFRHELARLAVEQSLPASRRRQLHRLILGALERDDRGDAARLAHHAAAAADADAVLRYAVLAAREASTAGAHRAAAAHLGRALERARDMDAGEQADLLSAWADERTQFDDPVAVRDLRNRAVHLRGQAGDRRGEARELIELGRMTERVGDAAGGNRFVAQAIEILEALPPSPELALAYASAAFSALDSGRLDEAMERATAALEIAETVDGTSSRGRGASGHRPGGEHPRQD